MVILNSFDTSIRKAFNEIDKNWESYDGLVIAGTHNPLNTEELINVVQDARENGIPFYGECFGHQICAIEYARNVLGIKDATSEEFGKGTFVVKKLPKLKVGLHDGESYWNNYEVDLPGWKKPDHFITCQFHASYQSSIDKPHELLVKFLDLCKKKEA